MRHASSQFTALALFAGTATAAGCSADTLDFSNPGQIAEAVGTSMSDCPTLDASITLASASGTAVITSACMRDDQGNYYASGLGDSGNDPGLPILPAGRSYSLVYQFATGFTPAATGLATASNVFVAPDPITTDPTAGGASEIDTCNAFPEDKTTNLVESTLSLDGSTLTQDISKEITAGEQVDAVLNIPALFPNSTCESGGPCGGFNIRFYVGHAPTTCPTAS